MELLNSDTLIILVSALAAAGSFAAFALPMLNRGEKKERYQSVIEKKRKAIFEQSRQEMENRGKADKTLSAGESMVMFFKVQELLGDVGERVRDQMLQAGIRSPSAPIKFIAARLILSVTFMGIAMFFIASSEKEISNSAVLIILMGSVFAGYMIPKVILKNKIQKRAQEISYTFPDALDMMLICVQGGIGLEQTVARIADEIAEHSGTLAEELGILSAEMAMLSDRRVALHDFSRRVGSSAAKSFSTALIQAEQYGTSVSQAMRVMADELREQRMATAEQKAMALPPKLTVPMIVFFLPVLFIVILGPAVLQAMDTF